MPTTSRNALRYPAPSDPPNGPAQIGNLASDVDGWLSRAYPCTSSTRPTSVSSGFMIYETDTGMTAIYDGSEWRYLAATGEVGSDAEYVAASAQSIPHGIATNTVVAFGTAVTSSPLVTRATSGAGHVFTLNRAGRWSLTTTIRFADATTARELYAGILNATTTPYGANGMGTSVNVPTTLNVAVTRRFAQGDQVTVQVAQSSGAPLALDPGFPGWVRLNLSWIAP